MDSFGSRLRHERERRQIALKSIAESTKIGITLLEGLERDDVSRWPSGIFRKSFVRSYAVAVGLDPERVLREFVERHPDPLEVDLAAPSAGARSSLTSPARHLTSPRRHHQQVLLPSSSPSPGADRYITPLEDWRIGRLSECCWIEQVRFVGFRFQKESNNRTSAISQHSANLPICQSPNAAFP